MGDSDLEHRYKIWPYAKDPETGEWSIPDTVMLGVWHEMVKDGRNKTVFYSGGMASPQEWMQWVQSEFNYPLLVIDTREKKIVFVAWFNSVVDRICFAHFCGIGKGTYRPEIVDLVMEYWSAFTAPDGSTYFRCILGMIPETNEKAIKLAERGGFVFIGTIPGICLLAHEGDKFVGGRLGYFIPKQGD